MLKSCVEIVKNLTKKRLNISHLYPSSTTWVHLDVFLTRFEHIFSTTFSHQFTKSTQPNTAYLDLLFKTYTSLSTYTMNTNNLYKGI